MKKTSKWIIALTTVIVALCVVIIFKINCRPLSTATIPPNIIAKELVKLSVAKHDQAIFDVICDTIFKKYDKNKNKVPYSGGILRNTDVLLSVGLNYAFLYNYVQCEQLRLKTMLGYDIVKNKIKMYAHPVEIQIQGKDTIAVDLVFDHNGNLYYANSGLPWQNPCKQCLFCGVASSGPLHDKRAIPGDDDKFVIDLNNPCPPCD